MSTGKRVFAGCMLLPVVLIGACCGKMSFDAAMYDLPGQVLKSTARPTQSLAAAFQVAEALDAYMQPRFEILRDKNFGALRIVYRRHAGILQPAPVDGRPGAANRRVLLGHTDASGSRRGAGVPELPHQRKTGRDTGRHDLRGA